MVNREIVSERLSLRPIKADDVEALRLLWTDDQAGYDTLNANLYLHSGYGR